VVSSLLSDGPSLQSRRVDIAGYSGSNSAGKVRITNPQNSYSGGTVIQPDTYLYTQPGGVASITALSFDSRPQPGQTPLGTGDITVYGQLIFEGPAGSVGDLPNNIIFKPGSSLIFNNVVGNGPFTLYDNVDRWTDTRPIALDSSNIQLNTKGNPNELVGPLSFDGGSKIAVSYNTGSGFVSGTIRAASFARVGRGTLDFDLFEANSAGVTDASGIIDANGIVFPYITARTRYAGSGQFLKVVNGLFQRVDPVNFDPASENEIAWVNSRISQDETAWGIVGSSFTTIDPGKTLTIKGGGIIGVGISGGTIAFDNHGTPVEAVVYGGADIGSDLVGSAGLTKFGSSWLYLRGDNSRLTGPITINDGTLELQSAKALPNQPVLIGPNATLDLGGRDLTLDSVSGSGRIINGGNYATFTFNVNQDAEFAGTLATSPAWGLSVNKTGPGTLTLSGQIDYNGTTHLVEGALSIAATQRWYVTSVTSGTSYPHVGPFVTEAGTNLLINSNFVLDTLNGAGNTTVGENASLTALYIRQNKLSLKAGAKVDLTRGNGGYDITNRLAALELAGTTDNWLATFDLDVNTLIVDGGDLATITNQIKSGLRGSPGLIASTAPPNSRLAAILNDDGFGHPLYTNFRQFPGLDGDEVIVRAVLIGDLNLDGWVRIGDFIDLASHFNQPGTWRDGDLDYDGMVGISDFITLASNFGSSMSGSAEPLSEEDFKLLLAFAQTHGAASVPEPAILLLLPSLALLARRRTSGFHLFRLPHP
jgi:autotransporter-associated beta strand protein